VLLLPKVAEAPELAPARAWSLQAVQSARNAWQGARRWVSDFRAPPAESTPAPVSAPEH
jgi:hypothetical protein